jgi:hypothetical protein
VHSEVSGEATRQLLSYKNNSTEPVYVLAHLLIIAVTTVIIFVLIMATNVIIYFAIIFISTAFLSTYRNPLGRKN